ncbi:hypothetical protein AX17_001790, partial [Amanita inopinata Kibby_2008]
MALLQHAFQPAPPRERVQAGALITSEPENWRPILQASNQVVLYNPTSHALSVDHSTRFSRRRCHSCPYCKQALPREFNSGLGDEDEDAVSDVDDLDSDPAQFARASNYFQLLELSNETSSRPSSPPPPESSSSRGNGRSAFPAEAMADGYFKAFFQEEYKLGMGANGSVFLCQHVLDGNPLGHFAVKKIAVGESHSYLLMILREVRLLEQMRHPNIITYHHAWLESCQFSAFGPKVPTLHVLMQWAEGGSLDDFIDVRLGRQTKHIHVNPLARFSARDATRFSSFPSTPTSTNPPPFSTTRKISDEDETNPPDIHSRSARIRAFRAFQKASPAERERMRREAQEENGIRGSSWKAVHLLSAEEVKSLFKDVVEGLSFLHEKSILHLDLKPGNVLLTWDEGKLIPRAMLSDFGTSRDMMNTSRIRSGNTGTLEYSSPETLPSPTTGLLRQVGSKADMWSLGMILHKLLFFRLPYRYAADGDANGTPLSAQRESDKLEKLEKEVLSYPGFKPTPSMVTAFEARKLPRSFLILLENLLNVVPSSRPSVERISMAMKEGKFNSQEFQTRRTDGIGGSLMIPVVRRRSSPGESNEVVSGTIGNSSVDNGLIQSSPGLISGQSTVLPDEEWQRQRREAGSGRETFAAEMMHERVKLLGPPEGAHAGSWWRGDWRLWPERWRGAVRERFRITAARRGSVRLVKSCILVAKVLTISLCRESDAKPGSAVIHLADRAALGWYQPLILTLLVLALLDTMVDELWVSVVLVGVHVGVLK